MRSSPRASGVPRRATCLAPDKASYLPKGAQLFLAEIKFRNPLKRAKSLEIIGELEDWLTANPRAATVIDAKQDSARSHDSCCLQTQQESWNLVMES